MGSDARQHGSRAPRGRCVVVSFVVALSACSGDGGEILAPKVPLSFTRFVHAVADTSATDWRFIDQLENSPVAFGLAFRAFTPYQATASGSRRLRVFPTSTNIDITSKFLIDTTLVFEQDIYYTIIHVGHAREGPEPGDRLVVLRDDFPRSPTATIAIRSVHLGTGLGSVDVFADTVGATSPLPATALMADLSFGAASTYAAVDPGRLALRITNTGQSSPIIASAVAPAGETGNPTANLTPIGGSRVPGSAISALLFPASVPGSSAPQAAAFTTPALVFLIDRHPR